MHTLLSVGQFTEETWSRPFGDNCSSTAGITLFQRVFSATLGDCFYVLIFDTEISISPRFPCIPQTVSICWWSGKILRRDTLITRPNTQKHERM